MSSTDRESAHASLVAPSINIHACMYVYALGLQYIDDSHVLLLANMAGPVTN